MLTADDSAAPRVPNYHALGNTSLNGASISNSGLRDLRDDAPEAKKRTFFRGSVTSGPQRGPQVAAFTLNSPHSLPPVLLEIFSENVTAKVLRVATEGLWNNNPPAVYPEFVPQHNGATGKYVMREADFWTCGFFPGILYLLQERAVKFPQAFPYLGHEEITLPFTVPFIRQELDVLCRAWTGPVEAMATRTDTHDMGFIIQPSMRKDWELTSNPDSLQAVLTAAQSLASRYDPNVGAIRSWDVLCQEDVSITSMSKDFLVIIDSMMNLDLLFYASRHLSDPAFATMAIKHAKTVMQSHLRTERALGRIDTTYQLPLYSHCHVVNFDPESGHVKERRTAQGYRAESTWARGQAWGIFGYAQTYQWTKDEEFLFAACGMAEYFLWRLETAPACVEQAVPSRQHGTAGRYVPLWDFDAPIEDETNPLRDSSAGVIAANGMLLLSQSMTALGDEALAKRYYSASIQIVSDTLDYSLSTEKAQFESRNNAAETIEVQNAVPGGRFDSILKNATANHNARDHHRYSDHGLVYADYYLLEFGNQLLRMGLV